MSISTHLCLSSSQRQGKKKKKKSGRKRIWWARFLSATIPIEGTMFGEPITNTTRGFCWGPGMLLFPVLDVRYIWHRGEVTSCVSVASCNVTVQAEQSATVSWNGRKTSTLYRAFLLAPPPMMSHICVITLVSYKLCLVWSVTGLPLRDPLYRSDLERLV